MTVFVQEYDVLRWLVVAAFGVAVVIVVGRLAGARPDAAGAGGGGAVVGDGAPGVTCARAVLTEGVALSSAAGGMALGRRGFRAVDLESDAAHLLMCLVMLAMLVFPAAADPRAVRGVLTAMTVVFAMLLVGRTLQRRSAGGDSGMMPWGSGAVGRGSESGLGRAGFVAVPGEREGLPSGYAARSGESVTAFAYHVVAAAAMLYAMSGHGGGHHGAAPTPWVMLGLAVLFALDAVLMAAPGSRRALRHVFPHPVGASGPLAVVPHVVMDLGTAYMLVAAVAGGIG
ncbi:DUF5134 domain-containing protein [Nocardia crassostreae]|uniref:DUF5134 domain-containing protein n=1 Tax=Nocardia crassostreae TaxID=53428 RepID=UPI0012FB58C2|nr:DUF5134 domain-containing protein [Nocardia crassostreae]